MLNRPEVMIAEAHKRFDDTGQLTHAPTRDFITQMLGALRDWTLRLRR